MTGTYIDWNKYINETDTFEERAVKDEGVFAIVSVGPTTTDEFYKLHIGLESGQILKSDEIEITKAHISESDLQNLISVVGEAY